MNPLISEMVPSERLSVIQSQVDHVLPGFSGTHRAFEETVDIQGDAALLTACIAHYDYDVPAAMLTDLIPADEEEVRMHIGWLRCEIKESKQWQRQWLYRYRAAMFFLRTWRPAPTQPSNRSLKAQKHEDAILSGR